MKKDLISKKLLLCFEFIKNNILSSFSGYIEINKNGFLHELENDDSFKNHFNNNEISSLIKSQYIEIFDMVFCELYYENEKDTYLNGAPKGKTIIPLSQITQFSKLYQAENNFEVNLLEINKLTSWVILESMDNTNKLECIFISDRMENGEVEYVSYEINSNN